MPATETRQHERASRRPSAATPRGRSCGSPATPAGTASAALPSRPGTAAKAPSRGKPMLSARSMRRTGSRIDPTPSATTSPPGPNAIPASERTNATYDHRICRVVDVEVEGIALKDWPLRELRRRHALALVDHMLDERRSSNHRSRRHPPLALGDGRGRDHRRSLRPQPFQGRPHPSQRPAGQEEAPPDPRLQLRGDAPLRQGRRPLRGDGPRLHRHRHEAGGGPAPPPRRLRRRNPPSPPHRPRGQSILEGTKTDHGEQDAGRVVPVPATLAWMLEAQINLNGPDCHLLFPTPRGRLWRERTFYRDVWKPTQEASGLDIRPHECRHSYVTHLRAAGDQRRRPSRDRGPSGRDDAGAIHARRR